MSACGCPGCGGRGDWEAEQRKLTEANRADFEAWLTAGKPPMAEWMERKAREGDKAYADVAVEAVS